MKNFGEWVQITEREREALEAALAAKLAGPDGPATPVTGSGGASPYSTQTAVFRAEGAEDRGARVRVTPVARSHDGAGRYKGRGRWRGIYLISAAADGPWAVCEPSDRGATEVGCSGLHVRPWAEHEAEVAHGGLGEAGAGALAAALKAAGLA